ncbi:MoaD/ThiS family protein [Natronorubrum thiooxidans]|uniref:Molybdopterin converting factor, small subunit n=1 Tax=Natronorubrum thiooxidans TaxID=308853 RepID=A0A1N7E414_9EURY|nr:pterin cluster protein [Natronorubrum thiooxidans]SIR82823.1 Molybdopterin converting factor, small subunit [Natronorubrum thiooxidans]
MATETAQKAREEQGQPQTTVTVRCTGHIRDAVGTHELEFTFAGDRLREFLEAFFAVYDVEDLLIAETEADATAHGWAPVPDDLPGTWRKNPEGDQTRTYARVCINGRFNEHFEGFETTLADGDRVALIYPFMFCC